ncbi:MAG: heme-binding domain-containing protein [Bacteroidetes bacterium]|nr:heme-binding domain-containing protein [Bacteroidota bacterium]
MKKKLTKKNIAIFFVFLLLAIQSFRIDKTTEPVDPSTDFITLTSANTEIAGMLKTACYDCHSNQPAYPWYTNIAPVSWWIKHHINEGSRHLNFSIWGTYTEKRKNHKLDECVEMIEKDEMPMSSYTLVHGEAKLTDAQKLQLVEFFKAQKILRSDTTVAH